MNVEQMKEKAMWGVEELQHRWFVQHESPRAVESGALSPHSCHQFTRDFFHVRATFNLNILSFLLPLKGQGPACWCNPHWAVVSPKLPNSRFAGSLNGARFSVSLVSCSSLFYVQTTIKKITMAPPRSRLGVLPWSESAPKLKPRLFWF